EAKHVIPIVLGVDHYLKLVIVVDDDIDVLDESDVMWAVATRMQADRDLVTIAGSLGAMLDPSADERGVTAKLGIDATRPFGEPFHHPPRLHRDVGAAPQLLALEAPLAMAGLEHQEAGAAHPTEATQPDRVRRDLEAAVRVRDDLAQVVQAREGSMPRRPRPE